MNKIAQITGGIVGLIGIIVFFSTGTYLWVCSIWWFHHWWGGIGLAIEFFVFPLTIFFPFIFWVMEGIFPLNYFIIWGVGVGGLLIASLVKQD